MKQKITQSHLKILSRVGLFLFLIGIILQLFPSENKFKYHFEVGKPWSYELMTASFDFPIYKDKALIKSERASLLQNYAPYYSLDNSVSEFQLEKLKAEHAISTNNGLKFDTLIRSRLERIYARGILSSQHLAKLLADERASVNCILPNRVVRLTELKDLYTPKTAYEEMLKDAPERLKDYNLNMYLVENLHYDSITSKTTQDELLKSLSLTSGMVQTGERIVDRGEIISPELYATLNSLKIEYDKRKSSIQQSTLEIVGQAIIIAGLIVLFFLYIHLFRPRIYDRFKDLLFLSLMILLIVAATALTIKHSNWSYYVVPYALIPIIIRVFYDTRTALFVHLIAMLIISFMVDQPFQFLVLQIIIGMVAVSSLKDMTQRSQLAHTALYIFLSYVAIYLAFEFIMENGVQSIRWMPVLYFAISSAFLLLAYILIYIFEKMFGLISAVTLMELTNVNSDLMMSFAEAAPGTFQHTLQVSNLATEAAKKIGANSLLVRTGALYHDIGKMKNPQYFIENQMGGVNPLSEMGFEEASQIVIKHVTDGVEIARKNHLPEQIINFITTHHGLGKTKYFYNSFVNAHPDIEPNEAAYTYPGPLPNSKETAILMMADAVEARSRSLGSYTEETINDAVEQMIDSQIADGNFKDAPISFMDVETVKAVFKEKIKNIYHSRIVYPELNKNK